MVQLRERLCNKAERRRSEQSCTHAKYNHKKIILESVSENFNSIRERIQIPDESLILNIL